MSCDEEELKWIERMQAQGKTVIVVGARQTGKTALMESLRNPDTKDILVVDHDVKLKDQLPDYETYNKSVRELTRAFDADPNEPVSKLEHWFWGLSRQEVLREAELIKQKKSTLPRAKRERILRAL